MAAQTLLQPEALHEIRTRARTLRPDSPRRWGSMSAHQAVCHLSDSLRPFLGEVPPPPSTATWFNRTVVRRIALHLPIQWPHGVRTVPGLDQVAGEGTPPGEFSADLDAMLKRHERFAELTGLPPVDAHPIFGPLTREEWMIWAYRHADHHLRQFGA